ncbi:hypothetical protein ACFVUY_03890 [Kitasatospora sp. NPDC058063]|uniref:hypothetical protein n=1 Tax=unclassified Kitasatospora TaxID=2633591 RepID=UPI0036DA296D
MTLGPIAPDEPRMRDCTRPQITALLGELHRLGLPHGLLWGSASPGETILDGRLLVDFGNAPVSTLLNLLHLLRDLAGERAGTKTGTATLVADRSEPERRGPAGGIPA